MFRLITIIYLVKEVTFFEKFVSFFVNFYANYPETADLDYRDIIFSSICEISEFSSLSEWLNKNICTAITIENVSNGCIGNTDKAMCDMRSTSFVIY